MSAAWGLSNRVLGSSRFSGKVEELTWEMGRNGGCYAAQITP